MIEDMTIRNLPLATQRSYMHAVAKFYRHFRPLAGAAWPAGRPRLSGASRLDVDFPATILQPVLAPKRGRRC